MSDDDENRVGISVPRHFIAFNPFPFFRVPATLIPFEHAFYVWLELDLSRYYPPLFLQQTFPRG